jgi:hypothetical protein
MASVCGRAANAMIYRPEWRALPALRIAQELLKKVPCEGHRGVN